MFVFRANGKIPLLPSVVLRLYAEKSRFVFDVMCDFFPIFLRDLF